MQLNNSIVLLTNQCNLRCKYCFEEHDKQFMSLNTAKDVLNYLHKSNKESIGFTFFGGEPMLCYDSIIVPLIDYSKTLKKRTRFAMTTNGTLLSKEKIDFLRKEKVNFMFSIDGGEETQKINRPSKNNDNFKTLEENLKYSIETYNNQVVRLTLIPETIQNLFNDLLYFESLGVKRLFMVPNYFQKWDENDKELYYEQLKLYEGYLIDKFLKKEEFLFASDLYNSLEKLNYLNYYKNRRECPVCKSTNKCGFGIRGSASCDVYGNFYGCHHISPLVPNSEWCIGNCYTGINEEKVKKLLRKYDQYKIGNENCSTCPLDKICNGGCCSNNYMIEGNINKVPEMFCFHNRIWSDMAYRLCKIFDYSELKQNYEKW